MIKENRNSSFSKIIDFLRFPLIVCVIFIHNHSYKTSAYEISSYTGGGSR